MLLPIKFFVISFLIFILVQLFTIGFLWSLSDRDFCVFARDRDILDLIPVQDFNYDREFWNSITIVNIAFVFQTRFFIYLQSR